MRFSSIAIGLLVFVTTNHAVPVFSPAVTADYDAIVVGGGPAGLSATSGLARVDRNVLLVDSGEYRNDPTRHAHDILGADGVTPAWLRFAGRKQIGNYETVTMVNGTVEKIEPQSNNTFFKVTMRYPGKGPTTYTSRKVVLATGMRDILPSTPGIVENWGKGIYWCPWCDGQEHKHQALGLLTSLDQGATTVREILTLNKDIIIFVNGTDTPAMRASADTRFPNWDKYLELHGISIENRTISSIERLRDGSAPEADPSLPSHPEHDVFQVNFESGDSLIRNAFFSNFAEEQKSTLGKDTGVNILGNKLQATNANGLVTNVPGIFAIGDCNSDNVTNVPHAYFTGKRTAVFLHVQLERENSVAELAASGTTKRGLDEPNMKAIWERMNPDEDVLHGGQFDG
ncbi:hypothetical protein VTL71DRAFT_3755 [Oculimacula yallundae]|uniref:FAD/NAD(P)-binding domain-containing protein n=1 Tax=Oculimacula yallundae TaxID=86028 RepID=A0ABR4C3U8_9HELO